MSTKRSSGQNRRVPDSPPYQPSDVQKPSLPPLKTILASSMTSPPRSPAFHCASVQPSPQEPTYTSATYKPPSLYPQKKQRTDYVLQPVPPLSDMGNAASPVFGTVPFGSSVYQASPRGFAGRPDDSPRVRFGDSRRIPVHPHSGYRPALSPKALDRPPPAYVVEPPASSLATINSMPREQTRSATPPRDVRRPSFRQGVASHAGLRHGFDRPSERRDSMQGCHEPDHTDVQTEHARQKPLEPDTRPPYDRAVIAGRYDSLPYPGRVERPPPTDHPRAADAAYSVYQNTQPSFFMPSQYDYRHGRARKRSNLPKQSTEIMKTWFDQNITNPYPSEEQKAIFSNATGISMTQVSNWFINHRRRCPELRDKRERTRGREFDV